MMDYSTESVSISTNHISKGKHWLQSVHCYPDFRLSFSLICYQMNTKCWSVHNGGMLAFCWLSWKSQVLISNVLMFSFFHCLFHRGFLPCRLIVKTMTFGSSQENENSVPRSFLCLMSPSGSVLHQKE